MSLQSKLKAINAEDGPNITLRTIAVYCGTSAATLSKYMNGKLNISDRLHAQIEKGLRELA